MQLINPTHKDFTKDLDFTKYYNENQNTPREILVFSPLPKKLSFPHEIFIEEMEEDFIELKRKIGSLNHFDNSRSEALINYLSNNRISLTNVENNPYFFDCPNSYVLLYSPLWELFFRFLDEETIIKLKKSLELYIEEDLFKRNNERILDLLGRLKNILKQFINSQQICKGFYEKIEKFEREIGLITNSQTCIHSNISSVEYSFYSTTNKNNNTSSTNNSSNANNIADQPIKIFHIHKPNLLDSIQVIDNYTYNKSNAYNAYYLMIQQTHNIQIIGLVYSPPKFSHLDDSNFVNKEVICNKGVKKHRMSISLDNSIKLHFFKQFSNVNEVGYICDDEIEKGKGVNKNHPLYISINEKTLVRSTNINKSNKEDYLLKFHFPFVLTNQVFTSANLSAGRAIRVASIPCTLSDVA